MDSPEVEVSVAVAVHPGLCGQLGPMEAGMPEKEEREAGRDLKRVSDLAVTGHETDWMDDPVEC